MLSIDLNSDLGESFGRYTLGNDDQVIKLVSSVNLACGFHAADPDVMAKTVAIAQEDNAAIGAHPGFPDLQGFGRRTLAMAPDQIKNMVIYQIGALQAFTRNKKLHHVKAHGALYNLAAKDYQTALAICQAIAFVDSSLPIYGLAGSQMIAAAKKVGIPYAQEVFADRNYQADGTLVPRSQANAVISDPEIISKRAISMIKNHQVTAVDGSIVHFEVDSICVHGDNRAALEIVKSLRVNLKKAGIQVKSF
ncbi:LamB/YcsF family protein [Oenococcus alcoholitolerans]|uniref:LamB/YcsF family protein n=1 Tax=Oenococcus alcoholitolerans TaxID=931074 RepID=UPI003F7091B9